MFTDTVRKEVDTKWGLEYWAQSAYYVGANVSACCGLEDSTLSPAIHGSRMDDNTN
jgi:hypothetical protein